MWTFILYLFIALQVAALAGGVATRRWPLRPQQLVWRGTTVEFAANQIQALLYDIDDVRFAYPTGQFVPVADETNHTAGKVVMREANFKGSKGLGVVFRLFAGCAAAAAEMASESVLIGLFGGFLLFGFAAFLAAPFLAASLIDVVYRALYRSRITAEVREHPSVPNAVTVDLTFRGLSSFGIVGDVLRAAATPAPPAGSRAAEAAKTEVVMSSRARASQWAGAAERRSSIVYGSGVAASVLAALVLALVVHPSTSNDYSYNSSADTSYSSGSDSSPTDDSTTTEDSTTTNDPTTTDDSTTTDSTAETTPTPAPNAYTSSSGNYSVAVPDGWIQNADEKFHPGNGAFTESKWHSAGDPEIFGLVDYTPGFSGTALEGALPIRAAHAKASDYEELDFSADGDARRYEFISGGVHKLDVFHKCGSTGVAMLVAAPADRWSDAESTLTDFVASFTCGSDSVSSGATSSNDTSGDSTGGDTSTTDVNTDQVFPTTTKAGLIELTIRRHWQARLDGDYAKAFGYYTGAVLSRVGTEAGWSEGIRNDGMTKLEFQGFRLLGVSSNVGRMEAKIHTESRRGGCDDWTFTYVMKHQGHWLIANSSADDAEC